MSPQFEAKINNPSKLQKDNVNKNENIRKNGSAKSWMTNGFLKYNYIIASVRLFPHKQYEKTPPHILPYSLLNFLIYEEK